MRGRVLVIWGHRKAEYFLRDDWTGVMGLNGRKKLVFRRKGFWIDPRLGYGQLGDRIKSGPQL
jgi:hypothetical protein